MAEKKLSIQERFNLLNEAYDFFRDLSDAGKESEHLWKCKAASIGTIIDNLRTFEDKMDISEWNDELIESFLNIAIDEDIIKTLWEQIWEEERDFYEGWFGFAIGVLRGNKETIDWFRELQSAYDGIIEVKLKNRTFKDLLS